MRIIEDVKLDFKDVLIQPKRSTLSSRKEVDLNRTFTFKHSNYTWTGVPIMAANMDGVGTWKVAKELASHNMFTCMVKSYEYSSYINNSHDITNNISLSIGTNPNEYERAKLILAGIDIKFLCIDVANGYSEHFIRFVEHVRNQYPKLTVIAGNVVTPDVTEELILRGADIVKIGIGPGSVCTTRRQTGVGYPQLSAVIECADAAHGLGGHIISDGGCNCPGDVAKAFGAGADFVMLGGMLSGHYEGGGEVINRAYNSGEINYENGEEVILLKKFVQFYGMSSETAMNKHHGGVANYRSSEGRTVLTPYKGPLKDTVLDLLGGLRSSCTYVGALNLKQLSRRTTFVRVSQQLNTVYGNEGL